MKGEAPPPFSTRSIAHPQLRKKRFPPEGLHNRLQLGASRQGEDDSLLTHQDTRIYLSDMDKDYAIAHELAPGRHAWLQVLRGHVSLNTAELAPGDGAAVSDELKLTIRATEDAEIMLFDLA